MGYKGREWGGERGYLIDGRARVGYGLAFLELDFYDFKYGLRLI